MTRVFEDGNFERFFEDGCGAVFSDMEFHRCRFINCDISITDVPELRSLVRNVKLFNCVYTGLAGLSAAIVEEVMVDGLKTNGLLQTWGMVFKHVTLNGRIGRIMISQAIGSVLTGSAPQSVQHTFDEANAAYYSTVDWALDISQAEFEECDIRGIPSRLIRRDPETQVVVTREKAVQGRHRHLDLYSCVDRSSGTYWDWSSFIDLFLKDGDPDVVLVAPKRHRRFHKLLDGLKLLRDVGVAEPE